MSFPDDSTQPVQAFGVRQHVVHAVRAGIWSGLAIGVCMAVLLVIQAPFYFQSVHRMTVLPLYLIVYPGVLFGLLAGLVGLIMGLCASFSRGLRHPASVRMYPIIGAILVPTWVGAQFLSWVHLAGANMMRLAKWNGGALAAAILLIVVIMRMSRASAADRPRRKSPSLVAGLLFLVIAGGLFAAVWLRAPRAEMPLMKAAAGLGLESAGGAQAGGDSAMGTPDNAESNDDERKPGVPHIVLITIDTLRADHLGCYGHPFPTSPTIDELAAKSIRFDRAYSHSSGTIPSFCGLFSCSDPVAVGVYNQTSLLNDKVTTFVEVLQDAGYRTAASVRHGGLTPPRGVAQGYMPEDYTNIIKVDDPNLVSDDAIEKLNRLKDEARTFHWFHYLAPHEPYEPPEHLVELMKRQPDVDRRLLPAYWYSDTDGINRLHLGKQYRDQVQNEQISLTFMEELYDAEIRWNDEAIKRVLDHMATLGWEEYVILITADHGESMGEHGIYCRHCVSLYDSQIRIPLIIHWSKMPRDPGVVAQEVVNSDFGVTLLDLAGLDKAPRMTGLSLKPFLESESAVFPARPIICQTAFPSGMTFKLAGNKYDYPDWCLIENEYKYIYYVNGVFDKIRWPHNYLNAWRDLVNGSIMPPELYELGNDDAPEDNLIDSQPDVAERMRRALLSSPQIHMFRSSDPKASVLKDLQALKDLGYVN